MTDRELDALVAREVMGWIRKDSESNPLYAVYYETPEKEKVVCLPNYSTDIAAAWEVVEKIKYLNPDIFFDDESNIYICEFEKARPNLSQADTPSKAICLAALKAVGFEL